MGGQLYVGIREANGTEHNLLTHTNGWPDLMYRINDPDFVDYVVNTYAMKKLKKPYRSQYGYMFIDFVNRKIATNNGYFNPKFQHFYLGDNRHYGFCLAAWEPTFYHMKQFLSKGGTFKEVKVYGGQATEEQVKDLIATINSSSVKKEDIENVDYVEMLDIPLVGNSFDRSESYAVSVYLDLGFEIIKDDRLTLKKMKDFVGGWGQTNGTP